MSPSDALLDTITARDELTWAIQLLYGNAPRPRDYSTDGPLPVAATLVRQVKTEPTNLSEGNTARLRSAQALAKVIITSGYAFNAAAGIQTNEDWPELLAFVREAIAQWLAWRDNQPWAHAAAYVADRCEAALRASSTDANLRDGAHRVLRHLATFAAGSPGFRPEWQLDTTRDSA
ncbi:hypothetical protein AB0D24_43665 [Streptomyces javensis]|uniref:hypothetical protein n=1 Tax=Streptomyces javensis TaxID=114698 RepID=UPI0033EE5958